MYAIQDDTIVKVNCKELIKLGAIEDARVAKIEHLVADFFETTVYELDVFYKDTPAKLMCCFLLHDLLHYSVDSIAKKYRIYTTFLQKNILEHYHKCLLDKAFFNSVKLLQDAFLDGKTLQPENFNNNY